jgi:hypothetical protein
VALCGVLQVWTEAEFCDLGEGSWQHLQMYMMGDLGGCVLAV